MARVRIPHNVAAEVMFRHRRTCCICNIPDRTVQIHHIDEDPSNNAIENLAVLCLECHNLTQISGGFGRKLGAAEVALSRDDWIARVARAKEEADKLIVARMAGLPPEPVFELGKWEPPSVEALIKLLDSLPETRKSTYEEAHLKWDTGYRNEMMDGTFFAMDVMTRVWLELAKWYPPLHFEGRSAESYFEDYIKARRVFHRAIGEPDGEGSGGNDATLIAEGGTLHDIEEAIIETARFQALWRALGDYDFQDWEKRWRESSKHVDAE